MFGNFYACVHFRRVFCIANIPNGSDYMTSRTNEIQSFKIFCKILKIKNCKNTKSCWFVILSNVMWYTCYIQDFLPF